MIEVYPISKKTEETFHEIRKRIFRLQNGRSIDSMERIGADTRGQIGASYPSLKNLASRYEKNQNVAQLLWGTGRREEQIVACFLFPAEELITEKITQLLQHAHSFEITEYFGTLVLSKGKDLEKKVNEYLNSGIPFLQCAALTAIARNRIDNKSNPVFTDSYILGIETNKFLDPHVQTLYNRLKITQNMSRNT